MRIVTLSLLLGVLAAACSRSSEPTTSANPASPKTESTPPQPSPANTPTMNTPSDIFSLSVETIDGAKVPLSSYRGKTLLIVNTASKCGYTGQYAGLEKLYETYKDRGFTVLAFPSNDFGGQEPGTHEEIKNFCEQKFNVTFPLFAKVQTQGAEQAPLYKTLTEQTSESIKGPVKWNFTKFLVNGKGEVVARFEPKVEPLAPEVIQAVESSLSAK